MTRYKAAKKPEGREDRLARLFKEGAVIQMHHPAKGVRYITNNEHAIEMARRRGYTDVSYREEVVRTPVVEPAGVSADAPTPKRGPGRPRKVEDKGGE